MATCTVSGLIEDITGTAIQGAVIKANLVTPYFTTTIMVMPKEISTTSASNGTWSLTLIQGAQAIVQIDYPPNTTDSQRSLKFAIAVPLTSTANFSTLCTEL